MGKFKDRKLSQANILRNEGVPALGTLEQNGNAEINPIGYVELESNKYIEIWTNYDINQCCARYEWEGLPNGLTSWNLERMLYFHGTLAGFKFAGKVYILPYTITGPINPYGLPVAIKPITYNGGAPSGKPSFFSENFELPVNINGDENDNAGAVLLYDSIPYSATGQSPARYFLNQVLIKEIADTFARVNINVIVSNKKIILQVKDPKQAKVVKKELEAAFKNDCPFAIISSPLDAGSIQSTSDFNADQLFNVINNYDSIRCFMSGITASKFGLEKKERLVSGELQGNEEQTGLISDFGLYMRQVVFADECNKRFGTNISCKLRAVKFEEEENGNGNTKKDEEDEL